MRRRWNEPLLIAVCYAIDQWIVRPNPIQYEVKCVKLYKYKAGKDRDVDALLNDQLWVSTLAGVNDPTDLGFYLKGKYSEADIVAFQESLNLSIVVASFSNEIQNRRLWNYYSDGMKGFVLTYRSEELVRAFAISGNKLGGRAFAGKISYGSEKYDLTKEFEKYLKSKEVPAIRNNLGLLFHKDESWEEEKEYRIAMTIGIGSIGKGFLLEHVRPYEVGVGYRMELENFAKVRKWCVENKITLRKYIPDFNSKKSNSPFKAVAVAKDGVELETSGVANGTEEEELPDISFEDIDKLLF